MVQQQSMSRRRFLSGAVAAGAAAAGGSLLTGCSAQSSKEVEFDREVDVIVAGPYDAVTRTLYTFNSGSFEYTNIPSFVIIGSGSRERNPFVGYPPGIPLPDWITRAGALKELAAKLEVDPDGLDETIKRFNSNAIMGVDPDYSRGESTTDRQFAGDMERADLKNPCLAPTRHPPYYGVAVWPGSLGTCGGL